MGSLALRLRGNQNALRLRYDLIIYKKQSKVKSSPIFLRYCSKLVRLSSKLITENSDEKIVKITENSDKKKPLLRLFLLKVIVILEIQTVNKVQILLC